VNDDSNETIDDGAHIERRGGARVNAGRPKGSKNKRTLAREAMRIEALKGGVTPMEYLYSRLAIYKKSADHEKAEKIASELMPYCHPRLSAVETKLDGHLSTYEAQPIPVEQRDSDAIGKTVGTA
jgi:hypothetical protein